MDVSNVAEIHEFYKKVKYRKLLSFKPFFSQFGDLLGVWKLALYAQFQLSISKIMPARPKSTGTWV